MEPTLVQGLGVSCHLPDLAVTLGQNQVALTMKMHSVAMVIFGRVAGNIGGTHDVRDVSACIGYPDNPDGSF